ncbi:MAG: bifunctional 3,4-dihydroxy-2-butanone-4-phosphate synthase/GTP cyclohydrolase II [Chlamydiales bacterium]|nr:bifunctional 3,4-dihydroxy-2-butanone-4-phosphate synthase/GTP cyclohydrolase II [Chlamydiales bacterium]
MPNQPRTPDESVEQAIAALKAGRFVLIADDRNREDEGDLVIAAEFMTPEATTFMVRYTPGVLTVPMTKERLDELRLPQMVEENTEAHRTAFTVSVDYVHETTTGISSSDRSKTIRALVDSKSKPSDFARPGHVFPLRYSEGGVLKRAGHTEASIDLCKLAGLQPVAVVSELMHDDGSMMRGDDLLEFAKKFDLPFLTIADLVRYRRKREKLVTRVSSARIPTKHGDFIAYAYRSLLDGIEHLALVKGDIDAQTPTLVRVHSECLTGDVFASRRCDCGWQLDHAMELIGKEGCGVVVYLRGHEGRGIGLAHKMRAYTLQDDGHDTVQANLELGLPVDSREYGIGAQILVDLGVTRMRLMTNNPSKYGGLDGYDLEIVERISITPTINEDNIHYLRAKQQKLGHLLSIPS